MKNQDSLPSAQKDTPKLSVVTSKPDPDVTYKYVFVRPLSKFYDKESGTLMVTTAFNQSEKTEKGQGTASSYFKNNGGVCVDGIGWEPCEANKRPLDILKSGRRTLVNTYDAPPNIQPSYGANIDRWKEMIAHIVPDPAERMTFIDHMAATVQSPQKKISWQILNYGAFRIGKDAILRPLVKYFGTLASEISPEMSATQWGDTRAKRKVLIFAEVLQPGDRSFENNLKLLAAGTATGIDTINMKGGVILEQKNLYSIYAMSNHTDCMHLSEGDSRWFVIDSFNVEKLAGDKYTDYFNWVDADGWRDVIAWLLVRDLSDFSWGRPPYQTAAYMRLVEESRSATATILAEAIEMGVAPCKSDLISTTHVRDWLIENRYKVAPSILHKELLQLGCVKIGRGERKVGGRVNKTPTLFAVRDVDHYKSMSKTEIHIEWSKWA